MSSGGQALQMKRAELLGRPDCQTPSIRADFVDVASSHAEIDHVAGRYQDQPDFLRRRVADAHAILDAKDEDTPEERLIAIVEIGSIRGQLALLDRERLPSAVVSTGTRAASPPRLLHWRPPVRLTRTSGGALPSTQ
jgi:hypothetical protein